MTLEQLIIILQTSRLDITRIYSNTKKSLPYLIYNDNSSDGIFANDKRVGDLIEIKFELYTQINDTASEKALEAVLEDNYIHYSKSDRIYFEDEGYAIVYYQITIDNFKEDKKL